MRLGAALVGALLAIPALAEEPVKLHAAGSLRSALNEVIANLASEHEWSRKPG